LFNNIYFSIFIATIDFFSLFIFFLIQHDLSNLINVVASHFNSLILLNKTFHYEYSKDRKINVYRKLVSLTR